MAVILCIETASTNCSVALSINGSVIALKEDNSAAYSHAERLHVFIEEGLLDAGTKFNELDAIAVSKGPGSYTGLRIGVSSAKGLCFALGIPLIAVPTLKSLAAQVTTGENQTIVAMMDARRMEVYSAIYDTQGKELRETRAEILSEDSFKSFFKGDVVFIGSGVDKFMPLCGYKQSTFMPDSLPSAKEMCSDAELKYNQNNLEDVAYFEPYYLKDFISS